MTDDIAIEAVGISKFFGKGASKVVALDGVSFELRRGTFTIVKGPSGSGKSSLLAALGGLQVPSCGTVRANDVEVWAGGERGALAYRRKYCGYVFQSHGLFPALDALSQIVIPLTLIGFSKKEAISRARFALESVGLGDRISSLPSELSGGQNQRVAIARMLAKKPCFIFCDEPTSALDSGNGRLVAQLLRETAIFQNTTILCMTHDDRLLEFSDRLIYLEDGKIISDSEKES